MNEYSKGITSDIDLTDHGDFQHGVAPILKDEEYEYASTPWKEDGKLKRPLHKVRGVRYITLRDEDFSNISITNSFSATDLQIHEYKDYLQKKRTRRQLDLSEFLHGKEFKDLITNHPITTDPKSILPYLKYKKYFRIEIRDTCKLYIVLENQSTTSTSLITYKKWNTSSLNITSDDMDDNLIKYYLDDISSGYFSEHYVSKKNCTISSTTALSRANEELYKSLLKCNRICITPKEFENVELTLHERYGKTLITGSGIEVKKKYQLKLFLEEVEKILDKVYQLKSTTVHKKRVCQCNYCGRTYLDFGISSVFISLCSDCVISKEMELFYDRKYHHLSRNDYNLSAQVKAFKMRGKAYSSFTDVDDQSYDYLNQYSEVIDFYRQPIHKDRGLHLIRLSRGQHELRVDLENGQFELDDSDEKRNEVFGRYELTYDKQHILEPIEIIISKEEMNQIRNLVNRA